MQVTAALALSTDTRSSATVHFRDVGAGALALSTDTRSSATVHFRDVGAPHIAETAAFFGISAFAFATKSQINRRSAIFRLNFALKSAILTRESAIFSGQLSTLKMEVKMNVT